MREISSKENHPSFNRGVEVLDSSPEKGWLTEAQRQELEAKVGPKTPDAVKALARSGVIPTDSKSVNTIASWCARHGILPPTFKTIVKDSGVTTLELDLHSRKSPKIGGMQFFGASTAALQPEEYLNALHDVPIESLSLCNVSGLENPPIARVLADGISRGMFLNLKALSLDEMHTDSSSISKLAEAIGTKSCHLEKLALSNLTIAQAHDEQKGWLESIARSLTLNSRIHHLELVHIKPMRSGEFIQFCQVASDSQSGGKRCCSLLSLDISNNSSLGHTSGEELAKFVETSGRLATIRMSNCSRRLALGALPSFPTWLQSLDCSRPGGGIARQKLEHPHDAKELEAETKDLTKALREFIKRSESLVDLDLAQVDFRHCVHDLTVPLRQNKTLVSVNAHLCDRGDSDIEKKIGNALKTIPTLESASTTAGVNKSPGDKDRNPLEDVMTPKNALKAQLGSPFFFSTCQHFQDCSASELTTRNIVDLEEDVNSAMFDAKATPKSKAHYRRVLDRLRELRIHREEASHGAPPEPTSSEPPRPTPIRPRLRPTHNPVEVSLHKSFQNSKILASILCLLLDHTDSGAAFIKKLESEAGSKGKLVQGDQDRVIAKLNSKLDGDDRQSALLAFAAFNNQT